MMARYIARGPVTLPTRREYRSGDTFEADQNDMAAHVAAGLAERLLDDPAQLKPPRRLKAVNATE